MQPITNNHFYEISYEESENLIIAKYHRFWPSKNRIPDYMDDWRAVLDKAQAMPLVIIDLSDIHYDHSPEIITLHERVLRMIEQKPADQIIEIPERSNIGFRSILVNHVYARDMEMAKRIKSGAFS